MQGFLDESQCNNIVLFGDFNAAHNSGRRFWVDLEHFVQSNSLNINDLTLPADTFTYLNTAHNTTSWIDHVITSANMNVNNIAVHYEAALYDHFPMSMLLTIPQSVIADNTVQETMSLPHKCIKWDLFKNEEIVEHYNEKIFELMQEKSFCQNFNCHSCHSEQIDVFYDSLIEAMKTAVQFAEKDIDKKFHPIPGWNDYCREKFQVARESFLQWVATGRVREGNLFEAMKNSRKTFRNSLKFCKYNEEQIRIEKLSINVLKNKPNIFWREVSKRTGKHHSNISEVIDGSKKPQEIANNFAVKFRSVNGTRDASTFSAPSSSYENDFNNLLDVGQLSTAIKNLKDGVGCDGLHAKHFKFLNLRTRSIIINVLLWTKNPFLKCR